MGFFSTLKGDVTQAEARVEAIMNRVEETIEQDVHALYARAHEAAIEANLQVNRLKADLQLALKKAADLHAVAVKAAQDAQADAEAQVAKLKSAVVAHTQDMNTQANQVVVIPEPVADAAPSSTNP